MSKRINEYIQETEQLVMKCAKLDAAILELCEACRLINDNLEELEYQISKIYVILSDSLNQ